MKIVFVTRELPISSRNGGIGSYVWDLAHKLVSRGHAVSIITAAATGNNSRQECVDGIQIHFLPHADFAISFPRRSRFIILWSKIRSLIFYRIYRKEVAKKLQELIKRNEVDIVEVPEFGNEAHYFLRDPQRSVPVVIRLHGPMVFDRKTCKKITWRRELFYFFQPQKEIASLEFGDSLSAPSQNMIDFIRTNYPQYHIPTIKLIYNSINLQDWPIANRSTKTSDNFHILFVGTLVAAKGIEELFESILDLRQKLNLDIRLNLVGKMGRSGNKIAMIAQKENYDWLQIIGAVDRTTLANYYANSDCICLPSWWESFGLVFIEAMWMNGCVIAGEEGGGREIFEDGIDGFLVPPRNVPALSSCIQKAMQLTVEEKATMIRQARSKVEERFSSNVIIPSLEKYYQDVISQFNEVGKR